MKHGLLRGGPGLAGIATVACLALFPVTATYGSLFCSRSTHDNALPPVARHDLSNVQRAFFPQASHCGSWQDRYARLHKDILSGRFPPRYFVSVAVEAGVADRLSGMVTQLYLALLSGRAFTAITYGDLPSFQSACESPYINWTHPETIGDDVVNPLKYTYKGVRGYRGDRSFGSSVNSSMYAALYGINSGSINQPWGTSNLSVSLPSKQSHVPYVVGASNRGRTFVIANNPYHKAWFWNSGLNPHNAFMCGLFFLCNPSKMVRDLYAQKYWRTLSDIEALKISITVRTGDDVFKGEADQDELAGERILQRFRAYFECAARIEDAFRLPRQRVIWLVNSDSLLLRRAAYKTFGDKVLTDHERKPVHPDCRQHNPAECGVEQQTLSMVHAMGQLFTSSMADYHVVPARSGFGRLGAWMSGRWNNLYELDHNISCDPHQPTAAAESALAWAGV